jgi:hypothetical protein
VLNRRLSKPLRRARGAHGLLAKRSENRSLDRGGPIRSPPPFSLLGFGSLRWLNEPRLDEGSGHALIVPLQLPARPRLHQVLEERYLLVLRNLALFVSDQLVHQSHETHLPGFGYHHQSIS